MKSHRFHDAQHSVSVEDYRQPVAQVLAVRVLKPEQGQEMLRPLRKQEAFRHQQPLYISHSSLKTITYRLWDEKSKRLVGYGHLKLMRK